MTELVGRVIWLVICNKGYSRGQRSPIEDVSRSAAGPRCIFRHHPNMARLSGHAFVHRSALPTQRSLREAVRTACATLRRARGLSTHIDLLPRPQDWLSATSAIRPQSFNPVSPTRVFWKAPLPFVDWHHELKKKRNVNVAPVRSVQSSHDSDNESFIVKMTAPTCIPFTGRGAEACQRAYPYLDGNMALMHVSLLCRANTVSLPERVVGCIRELLGRVCCEACRNPIFIMRRPAEHVLLRSRQTNA
jgi:hypothetical protein